MVDDGVQFELWKLGMVCATSKPEEARKVLRSLEGMRKHGYELPDDILGEDEIRAIEPSLNDRVKAGFHLEGQWNVKADTMTVGLGSKLREMGVEILAVEGSGRNIKITQAEDLVAGEALLKMLL